jgi:nicotinate phosphoribosyltransferase
MSQHGRNDRLPEGIHSLLDTDLYKLTMQAALLQHYPNTGQVHRRFITDLVEASYIYINRTKSMRINYEGYTWLKAQINGSHTLGGFR